MLNDDPTVFGNKGRKPSRQGADNDDMVLTTVSAPNPSCLALN